MFYYFRFIKQFGWVANTRSLCPNDRRFESSSDLLTAITIADSGRVERWNSSIKKCSLTAMSAVLDRMSAHLWDRKEAQSWSPKVGHEVAPKIRPTLAFNVILSADAMINSLRNSSSADVWHMERIGTHMRPFVANLLRQKRTSIPGVFRVFKARLNKTENKCSVNSFGDYFNVRFWSEKSPKETENEKN